MHPAQFERIKEASGGTEGFGPLLVPLDDTFRALGIGRTKGFALIHDGHLIARNIGSRTLIEAESIRRFAATLPRAGVRMMRARPQVPAARAEAAAASEPEAVPAPAQARAATAPKRLKRDP